MLSDVWADAIAEPKRYTERGRLLAQQLQSLEKKVLI
jgi:hypothetical protein